MAAQAIRTTVTLPADLVKAADQVVSEGKARSRNELLALALRHELGAMRRAEIDAQFAKMANDPEYLGEVEQLMREFASADAETACLIEQEEHTQE
jgi:metal-responsive CopG/Arc/MetJ family transcriptional regulator